MNDTTIRTVTNEAAPPDQETLEVFLGQEGVRPWWRGPVGIVTRAGDDLPVAGLAFVDSLRAVVAERRSL
jgi:hypothetical protein